MASVPCGHCGFPASPQDAFCRGCGVSFNAAPPSAGYYQSPPGAQYPHQSGYSSSQAGGYYSGQSGASDLPRPPGYSQQSRGQQANQPGSWAAAEPDIPIVAPYAATPGNWGLNYSTDPRHWVWRQEKLLVFHESAELPDRCIKCNEPAGGIRLKKRLSWLHPAWTLLVLAGLLIYLIVAACVRKKANVSLGYCERHFRQRRAWITATWLLFISSLVGFYLAVLMQSGWTALGGLGLLIASAVAGSIAGGYIGLKKIANQYVWLKDVDEVYLSQFPRLT